MVFDFHSKKNIIIVVICITLLAGVGVWFFLYRMPHNADPVSQISEEVAQIESPDDIRIKHMKLIEKSVTSLLQRGEKLPLPQKAFDFRLKEVKIGYQGVAGSDFYDAIGLTSLLDPVTESPYNYYVSDDRTEYKIFSYLKDETNRNGTVGDKSVFSVGSFTGGFLISSSGDIVSSPGTKIDLLDNAARKKIGFGSLQSCNDILQVIQLYTRPKSGVYYIDAGSHETKTYCDMQTDGGGWTLFYANNGHPDSPIKQSYVEMRDALEMAPAPDLSNYTDPNLAGLLDFRHFTAGGGKEILIRNRTGDEKKWVKFTFSTARILEWALGPAVLGKTDYGCIKVPHLGTWSIINDNGKIKYDNLAEMMNHGGTSWGVSHEKYLCNGYDKRAYPHIGFHDARSNKDDSRARSDDGNGGKWGGENEYRYFVR